MEGAKFWALSIIGNLYAFGAVSGQQLRIMRRRKCSIVEYRAVADNKVLWLSSARNTKREEKLSSFQDGCCSVVMFLSVSLTTKLFFYWPY